MSAQDLGPVNVVTASAGTGKTHRLIVEVATAIAAGHKPSAILATTFTNRAAAELVSRARGALVESGKGHEAEGLLAGRFGTVNSVFGALLREFAFEGRRSPVTEVIPEERAQALFRTAADKPIGEYADRLQGIADRLAFTEAGGRGTSWSALVSNVVHLSRVNGIAVEKLTDSRDKSWRELEALLEPCREGETPEGLDSALRVALDSAIKDLGSGDGTQTTQKVIQRLREILAQWNAAGSLPWQQWAALSKLKAAVASNKKLDRLRLAAAAHARHPRMHSDVKGMIDGVFACAAESLEAYREYKLARGLVDFADQEAEALRLLERPEVARVLKERLELALVDEFQDTSPIQLALFLRIARIVRRSLWVGDPKQSIYSFRGSDPELMTSVASRIPNASGGATETLAKSYRARPGLLRVFNDIFIPVFERQGIARAQTECSETARGDAPGQGVPLAVWVLDASKKEVRAAALASGVRQMMSDRTAWSIVPKGSNELRALKGSDVAILCRTKSACKEVAEQLEAAGLQVALGREGLLNAAECALAVAALRWLADDSDTLALAEIAHLANGTPQGEQPSWFATVIETEGGIALLRAEAIPKALDARRPDLLSMTPSEALDAAIGDAEVLRLVAIWGETPKRLANLDALRRLAQDYEEEKRQSREPATANGLVAWLTSDGGEKPASGDDNAITVCTYHAAKGLEWPVVILHELNFVGKPRLFDDVVAEGAQGGLDLDDPLKERWLRFWPWPYGAQDKDVGLDTRVDQSEVGRIAAERAAHEDVRLLYVALTRARDYLVLALDKPKAKIETRALDGLVDKAGIAALVLPSEEGQPLVASGNEHPCRCLVLAGGPSSDASTQTSSASTYDTVPKAPGVSPIQLPYRFRPSDGAPAAPESGRIVERHNLGERLPIIGSPEMSALGDAVHGFLAADRPERASALRLKMAEDSLYRWGVAGALSPNDVVKAADRLWNFCSKNWPASRRLREWPVVGSLGRQRVQGRIDLLLESESELIIIDHKTYPGAPATWDGRAAGYSAQLSLYSRLCSSATSKVVSGLFVHLPIAGAILQVEASSDGTD